MRLHAAILAGALCACGPAAPPEGPGAVLMDAEVEAPAAEPAFAPAPADDPFVIVFLGDSLFAGYQLETGEAVPDVVGEVLDHPQGVSVEIVNASLNGGLAESAVRRFPRAVPEGADAVLIEYGANDIFRGRSADDIEADLVTLIEMTHTLGARPILVSFTPPPRGAARPASGLFADAARRGCAALYPYYFAAIIDESGRNLDAGALMPDGLHPNAEGARAIGRHLADWLEGELARPAPCAEAGAAP